MSVPLAGRLGDGEMKHPILASATVLEGSALSSFRHRCWVAFVAVITQPSSH